MNPMLGRHFRKKKHARREYGDAFDEMLDLDDVGTGLLLYGALEAGMDSMSQGFQPFSGGAGMMDDVVEADGGGIS
eukprot:CAMPEP_0113840136 /NCGR_PEP_ID=MMETSP0328-20130328/11462_1 /TAXON_ID=39455 /ORGANISM="Alexandrium minutum" /LENGTH=75 /DNA_ID=CAMNT_0000808817 /DNA_START=27 /DNA_END=250 /DNA_ORIENTATION=- /assembly_acc=CAM_ASM_000350